MNIIIFFIFITEHVLQKLKRRILPFYLNCVCLITRVEGLMGRNVVLPIVKLRVIVDLEIFAKKSNFI